MVFPEKPRHRLRQQRQVSDGSAVPGETLEQETRRLRREVATLKQEQAFAKKKRRRISTGRLQQELDCTN